MTIPAINLATSCSQKCRTMMRKESLEKEDFRNVLRRITEEMFE